MEVSRKKYPWNYNGVKMILDQIGHQRYVSIDVFTDIVKKFPGRSEGAIRAIHYKWLIFNGILIDNSKKSYIGDGLRQIFEAYVIANGEKKLEFVNTKDTVTKIVKKDVEQAYIDPQQVSQELDKEIAILEESFESMKQTITNVIMKAVEQKVEEKTKEMKHELIELRKFKESVRTTSVFMKLRQTLTGKDV